MSTTLAPPAAKRNIRRWCLIVSFLLLLLATPVGYYYFTVWQHERELQEIYRELDAADPNWRWPDLVAQIPRPPLDERNSALQIVKVGGLLKKTAFTPPTKAKNANEPPNAHLQDRHAKSLREAFGKLGPTVLPEARKLAHMPDGRFPIEGVDNPLEETKGPNVDQGVVAVMTLLQQDARLRAHEGDIDAAAESCQALLNSAHAINDYPGLMANLIRTTGQQRAGEALERTLGNGIVSEKRLQELAASLLIETEFNGLYHALRSERAFIHRVFELMNEGKVPYPDGTDPGSWLPVWVQARFPSLRLRGYAEELRLLNEDVKASKTADDAQVHQLLAANRNAPGDIIRFVVPRAVENRQLSQALLRCAVTAVAAERYRLQRGNWPDAADDLVKAGLLKVSLKDPYDSQPLRWKRTPTGVMIYSVGPDRIDNGGQLDRGDARSGDLGFELWLPNFRHVPAPAIGEKK